MGATTLSSNAALSCIYNRYFTWILFVLICKVEINHFHSIIFIRSKPCISWMLEDHLSHCESLKVRIPVTMISIHYSRRIVQSNHPLILNWQLLNIFRHFNHRQITVINTNIEKKYGIKICDRTISGSLNSDKNEQWNLEAVGRTRYLSSNAGRCSDGRL